MEEYGIMEMWEYNHGIRKYGTYRGVLSEFGLLGGWGVVLLLLSARCYYYYYHSTIHSQSLIHIIHTLRRETLAD
jgi:hypothetical protein